MSNLSLTLMARELLQINEVYWQHTKNPQVKIADFQLHAFTQVWGNTSGGMEGMGGCAMTEQNTYVLVPLCDRGEKCQVYFDGRFAYSVPLSNKFLLDVRAENVAGLHEYHKYVFHEEVVKLDGD